MLSKSTADGRKNKYIKVQYLVIIIIHNIINIVVVVIN